MTPIFAQWFNHRQHKARQVTVLESFLARDAGDEHDTITAQTLAVAGDPIRSKLLLGAAASTTMISPELTILLETEQQQRQAVITNHSIKRH
jgi:hypothetical protein